MARIFVIDDDTAVSRVLALMLTRNGHEAETYTDGRSALRAFRENPADLIVTDVYMPEMDGFEFLLELDEIAPNVPVIVISGGGIASIDSVLTDANYFGACSTLAKPIGVDELIGAVRDALPDGGNGGDGGIADAG